MARNLKNFLLSGFKQIDRFIHILFLNAKCFLKKHERKFKGGGEWQILVII